MLFMPRAFPEEFRRDVDAVARRREAPQNQIAEDFGISHATLSNWLRQADIEDGDKPGVSRNQAIFKHIFIDHDEIIDHDLEDPLGDLFTVQTIYHASTIGAPPGRLHDLAQASWAKHYQTKKKGAAHMGDSLTSLTLEAPPNPAHRVGVCSKPHLVGVTGFEPATSSSRTKRATKLRHTPLEPHQDSRGRALSRNRTALATHSGRATRLRRVASGRHAKRTGVYGEVPRPALTCSHIDPSPPGASGRAPGQPCSPLARRVSRSQFVTSAPHPGTASCPPCVCPAKVSETPSASIWRSTREYGACVTPTRRAPSSRGRGAGNSS